MCNPSRYAHTRSSLCRLQSVTLVKKRFQSYESYESTKTTGKGNDYRETPGVKVVDLLLHVSQLYPVIKLFINTSLVLPRPEHGPRPYVVPETETPGVSYPTLCLP